MKEVVGYSNNNEKGKIMLNANESTTNVSDEIRQEIHELVDSINFNRYPDDNNQALIEAYAKMMNIDADCVLAGRGGDEMLGFIISSYLGKDKKLYTLNPDFSMYDYYAQVAESDIIKYDSNEDGSFDVDGFIEKGLKAKVNMVVFSNPNNPSGFALDNEALKKIANAFKEIPFVIDEAYGEFHQNSFLLELDNYENVFLIRTLSKAYGLANMRIGFLIGNKKKIQAMKGNVVPYNINSFSAQVAMIVLKHADEYKKRVLDTIALRDELYTKLAKLKRLKVYPSKANYIYGRSDDKKRMLELLKEQGIVIRDYSGKDSFRITIGSREEMEEVLKVLTIFDEEGR